MVHKWNVKQIRENKRYIESRLKNHHISGEEKEKLRLSLITNVSLLCASDSLFHTKLGYAINDLLSKKFSVCRERKYAQMESDMFLKSNDYIDEEYINFLFKIAQNLSADVNSSDSDIEFSKISLSEEDMIKISESFYQHLGDNEILTHAKKTLNGDTLQFQESSITGYEDAKGLNLGDWVFNKSYCIITNSHDLYTLQALNHEVMHTVDFYECDKLPSEKYYGFQEVPTYTIDYLFIDYLDELGFDNVEIQKLRDKKFTYLQDLAKLTILKIKTEVTRAKGLKAMKNMTAKDIMESVSVETMKHLLELESGVIAYGLQSQIKNNKEIGINNLKQLMKKALPKDKKPDFSDIGLTDEILLELSSELGAYSRETIYSENIGKPKL